MGRVQGDLRGRYKSHLLFSFEFMSSSSEPKISWSLAPRLQYFVAPCLYLQSGLL